MAIDAEDYIAQATEKDTFDVFAFVQGTNTPEDEVTIYTDADAALKLAKIFIAEEERAERAKNEVVGLSDEDETADEDEITALHERLAASGLVFKLKGLAPKAREAIEKKLRATTDYKEGEENTEFNEALNATLIAKSIVSVTNAAGAVASNAWTVETVNAFTEELYVSEANKLFGAVAQVNYVGAIFDRAINADFS